MADRRGHSKRRGRGKPIGGVSPGGSSPPLCMYEALCSLRNCDPAVWCIVRDELSIATAGQLGKYSQM
jgi:hypothetical protein